MSLWFSLKIAQRTILSILPEIRPSLSAILPRTKNFHSLCFNNRQPVSTLLKTAQKLSLDAERGMKSKGRLKLRCRDCYIVHRQGRGYVMCKTSPRHKQQIIVKKEKHTWRLTHATQSKVRPW